MNRVILTGRLVADPEINTYGNTTVATYRLAVDRQGKKDGKPEADFLTCKVFGKATDFVSKYLHKGIKIAIEGRIRTGSYEKDGVKHYTTEIIVEQHEFCEKKAESSGNSGGYTPPPPGAFDFGSYNGTDDFRELDDEDGDLPF